MLLEVSALKDSPKAGAAIILMLPCVVWSADAELNVSIEALTLIVANNSPIAPGGEIRLVWSDEFDGARLDPESWFFESGDGSQYSIPGWGNSELQCYLPDYARIENGNLVITARREPQSEFSYTSARINTRAP